MTAGQPDWAKLAKMGRLPVSARDKLPYLAQLDAAESRIKELENENNDLRSQLSRGEVAPVPSPENEPEGAEPVQLRCDECGMMVSGKTEQVAKMQLGRHQAKHKRDKEGSGEEDKKPEEV